MTGASTCTWPATRPHEAGIGRAVHEPPGSPVTPNVYGTDLATLRFLAEARHLKLLSESDVTELEFGLWDDRRASLRTFVQPHERSGLKTRHCGYSAVVRMTALPRVAPTGCGRPVPCTQITDI